MLLGMINVMGLNIQDISSTFANASEHSETLAKQSCNFLLPFSEKPHLLIISLNGDGLHVERVLRVKVSTTYLSKALPIGSFGVEGEYLKNKQKQKSIQAKSWKLDTCEVPPRCQTSFWLIH